MSKTDEWEDVTVAPGNYVKWIDVGDQVTGWVVDYNATAGTTDFDGNECGVLVLDDNETRELRTITLDKGALKDAVAAAVPKVGLLMRITHDRMIESKSSSYKYKGFTVQVNTASKPPARPANEDEEPF